MGYDYGFHLVLAKPPKAILQKAIEEGNLPLNIYAKEIVDFCIKNNKEQNYETTKFYFPEFGEIEHGGSKSYGCGNQNDGIEKTIAIIGKKFPDAVFDLHFYYWDMTNLIIYTFQEDKVLNITNVDFENYQIGPYKMCMHIDFMRVSMDGNMSIFFNDDYGYEFSYEFSCEKLYEMAEVPLPVKQYNFF
jgi:hypothetical protein